MSQESIPPEGADTAAMKMHALQNTHIAVHNVLSALSGARIEVTEQIKGKAKVKVPSRGAAVFCPPGSGNPTPVSLGYYTNLRNTIMTQVEHPTVKGRGKHEPSEGRSGVLDEMAYEQ